MTKDFCFKILALILIVCILVPAVPYAAHIADTKPGNPYLTYSDDFSDGVIAPNIETNRFYPGDEDGSNADTLVESGGKLVFERKKWVWNTDKNYGEPAVKVYASENKKSISGDVFAEFSLARTREVVRVRFCDSNGNYITQLAWQDNSISMNWREEDLSNKSKSIAAPSGSTLKISIRANISSSRPVFSLWINDELQIDNKISYADVKAADFAYFQVYTLLYSSYSKAGNFTIDDVGIGYSEKADLPSVESSIVENGFDTGKSGCYIQNELSGGGSVLADGGVLTVSKTGSGSSQVGASVYMSGDTSHSVAGVIGMEFDVERELSKAVQIRSMDANGNIYYSFSWGSESISANYSDDPLQAGDNHKVWSGKTNKIHVNMMFDTQSSKYWMWINDTLAVDGKYSRSAGAGSICYTMFYIETQNEISVCDYSVYNAVPPERLRLEFDTQAFSESDILKNNFGGMYAVTSDISLPQKLRYGTSVTWKSSDSQTINPQTGEVTRPTGNQNSQVILTAHFENGGLIREKTYTLRVLRMLADGENPAAADIDELDISLITDEAPDKIRKSLKLFDEGFRGSSITWTSSDPAHITASGRVVRPRFDEPDAEVVLTASNGEYTKSFEFTVIADEVYADPMHTSDEEFFGVWNGNSFSVDPQLDYTLSGLSEVEACVKSGDYAGAKNALLQYFKSRNVPSPIGLGTRHTGWVDARADGVFELGEEAAYYRGLMTVTSDDFEPVTVSLYNPGSISKSDCKTFELMARYNEYTSAYALGTDAEDPDNVPQLKLTVNGKERTYKANGSASVRAGKYSVVHCGDNEILEAKMFGDFLSDETLRILLSFDLSDIGSNDTISKAELTVYAKKSSSSALDKQLWIIDNKGRAWDERTVTWNSLNFAVHNYNGLVGGVIWKSAPASDVEYAYQLPRFAHARNNMAEYRATGDEKYAYSLLGQVMDIITDTGSETPYPRSLDAALRMHQLVPLMNTMKNSPYMTADFCTTFMKYMFDQFEYFPTRIDATGNWREYEQLAVLYATVAYPELINSSTAMDSCILSWKNALEKSFMPDGSYIEDTGGYHRNSFNMYRDFKKNCMNSGVELPAEFDTVLHKAAYYMALTSGPDGLSLQYGDEGGGRFSANRYAEICDWYDDDELRFIDSFGAEGTKPDYTSYQFPDGKYTIMRSDWTKDALYLHTNVRGGGGHGHADDNSIILMAGGRRLLVDAGKFTYNSYDPARIYGLSTRGHNTLVINNASQRMGWTDDEYSVRGNIEKWISNSKFDYLSQTTISYPQHNHTRNIFFDKAGLFVVSDIAVPHDTSSVNNYRQYWHMLPEANISSDTGAKILSSNFKDGKNLIIASADEVNVSLEDGYYDIADATVVSNKAGVFEKETSGTAMLDTVMYVSEDKNAKVNVQKISGANEPATLLKINVSENGGNKTYYYMNTTEPATESVCFEGFTTDARTLLVCEDEDGIFESVMMISGSYISNGKSDIVRLGEVADDFAVLVENGKMIIESGDSKLNDKPVSVADSGNIGEVEYNGRKTAFVVFDGAVHIGIDEAYEASSDLEAAVLSLTDGVRVVKSGEKNYLTGNIDMSLKKGANGSEISYHVSDGVLVSDSGVLRRNFTDKDVTITVRAVNGKISLEKELRFTIPGKYNKTGKEELPFVGDKYDVERVIADSNTSGSTTPDELTAFENTNGRIKFTTAYATGKEPGFTAKYSEALSGEFVHEYIFSSDSAALRTRFSDSSWQRKLDIYYLDNGTLVAYGNSKETHSGNFRGKTVELRLCFNTPANTVDVYIGGELWLDDFLLNQSGYKNIKFVMITHHCATILSNWRSGQGTTNVYSMDAYTLLPESEISPIMTSDAAYSNGGVPNSGVNTVSVPVVATDKYGEDTDAILVYAMYSESDAQKLIGVSYEKIDLERYSHKEYTVSVTLDKEYPGAVQKVFVLYGDGSLRPAECCK